MQEIKTPLAKATDVGVDYLAPVAVVATPLSIVLAYFFDLPTEVAIALSAIIFAVLNFVMVYVVERILQRNL